MGVAHRDRCEGEVAIQGAQGRSHQTSRAQLAWNQSRKWFSQGATANGLRAALGTTASFGKLGGRVEASLTRYSWTFKNDGTAGANGASDSIKLISVVLGYAY